MKRFIFILCLFAPALLSAQESDTPDWVRNGINIKEITVYGQRPMKEIGTQQTKFDTVALKENIALSMAEGLGTGLQNLLQRFDSASHLKNKVGFVPTFCF